MASVRAAVEMRGVWHGSLAETLDLAARAIRGASMRRREEWGKRGWSDPMAVLVGWVAARHWDLEVDEAGDRVVVRMRAKLAPKKHAAIPEPGPRLF